MAETALPSPVGARRNASPVPSGGILNRPLFPGIQRVVALELDWELTAYIALVAIAFTFRIWDVGARAMHHDESLHATYAWYLFKGQGYQYDPVTHGPLQFFAMAFFYLLFGDSETTARLFAVLCGTALVFLPYLLRKEMGQVGAFVAAIALAISPAFLYYSRFARDDIILCFFALVIAVSLWRFLDEPGYSTNSRRARIPLLDRLLPMSPPRKDDFVGGAGASVRHRWVYVFAAAAALAMATMEAAYILFFIFGTFIGLCLLAEWAQRRRSNVPGQSPVTSAIRSIPLSVWLYALTTFVVITILLYSTFFTNPRGVFDIHHSLLSANRQDILGGLTYWLSQHGVARGGQPWFYYLLLFPLYEQFALIFAAAGIVWAFLRRDLFVSFLAYWLVLSLAIYSWAGEKMPWLLLHPLLPAVLLAATIVGRLFALAGRGWRAALITVLALLAVVELHSSQALVYADGANPTEMLIYVQTSNDVPMVAREVTGLVNRIKAKTAAPLVQVDSADLQGWPFEWYFRNLPSGDVTYSANFASPTAPILLMLGPEDSQFGTGLAHRYVVSKYIWNWWFPEDYKGLTFDDGMCGTASDEVSCAVGQTGTVFLRTGTPCPPTDVVAGPNCSMIQDVPAINVWSAITRGSTWRNLWNWFAFRTPFGQRGSRPLYLFVRKDLVPKSSGSTGQPSTGPQVPGKHLSYTVARTMAAPAMVTPKGMAFGSRGNLFVADAGSHGVYVFGQSGRLLRSFGSVGTSPGQFNLNESPMSVAVGPNRKLYVADFWNHRVEEFTTMGKFVRSWGSFGASGAYGFYGPRSVAVEPNGNVVVADTGNRRVAVFSPTGHFLFQFGTAGSAFGQFDEPSAVAVGHHGTIYVADFWNSRIQYFTSKGSYLGSWQIEGWQSGSYEEPYLAVLSNGNVAAAVPSSGAIYVYTARGKPIGQIVSPLVAAPDGIAAGPHGSIAVSNGSNNGVTVLRPQHRLKARLRLARRSRRAR